MPRVDGVTILPVPTMPIDVLTERRAPLEAMTREELERAYFALPGRTGDRTLMSDEALVDVIAWAGEVLRFDDEGTLIESPG